MARRPLWVAQGTLLELAFGRSRWLPPAGDPRPCMDRIVPLRDRARGRGSYRRQFAGGTTGEVCSLGPGSLWRSDAGRCGAWTAGDPDALWTLRLAGNLRGLGYPWTGSQHPLPHDLEPRGTSPGLRHVQECGGRFSLPLPLDDWARAAGNAGGGPGDCPLAGGLFCPFLWAVAFAISDAGSRGTAGRPALSPSGWPVALAHGLLAWH